MELLDGILWILAPCLLAVFAYKKLTRNHGFWRMQNVPYVPAIPFIGSFQWGLWKKPLQVAETAWYNLYGRVYGRYEGNNPVISVGDPDILKKILSTDFQMFANRRDLKFHDPVMDNTLFVLEGEAWTRVRNIVSPAFTTAKLKRMYPLLTECSDLLVERFAEIDNQTSDVINCQEYFGGFVLSAIARCAFGMNISAIKEPKSIFVEKSKKLFEECCKWRTYLTILCPSVMKFFRLKLLNPETTDFYRQTIIKVLEERKSRPAMVRDDFLQMLMDAEDANNNDTTCAVGNCNSVAEPVPKKKVLTHDEMLSQSITFFIAGFDATTSLLSHLTYQMAMNQHYQDMVVEELRRALDEHNGELCYEALAEMKFLNAMIHECMRMCPAMARYERRAEEDYFIENENIHLKKGTIVSIPVYAMHHDPEWYPEPEVFKPERFYPEEVRVLSKYNFLPFGNGKRMCVGMRFVNVQVKQCIAKLLMNFQILPTPSTPKFLEYTETRNVLTVNKVEVRLRARELF